MSDRATVTPAMLAAAVRKAVAVGLLYPFHSDVEAVEVDRKIKAVVEAALAADGRVEAILRQAAADTRHIAAAERAGEQVDGETMGFVMRDTKERGPE